jgi:hypothetical protein
VSPSGFGGRVLPSPGGLSSLLPLAPAFWVRADKLVTLGVGQQVTAWGDLSGNNRNLANTSTEKPLAGVTVQGQAALDFTNGLTSGYSPVVMNTSTAFPTTATRTVFLVLSFIGAAQGTDARIYTTVGDFTSDIFVGANDPGPASGNCSLIVNSSTPRINGGTDAAGASFLTALVATSVGTLYQNGVQVATQTVTPITPTANESRAIGDIGGGDFTALFYIAEAAEWLVALSAAQLAQLNGYAQARYHL